MVHVNRGFEYDERMRRIVSPILLTLAAQICRTRWAVKPLASDGMGRVALADRALVLHSCARMYRWARRAFV